MLVVGWALSTPAAAQQRSAAWMIGLAATVGSGWQMEGADIGFVRPIGMGPLRFASITGRFGTFQDEGSLLFGARGFLAGLALGATTGSVQILAVGSEQNPVAIALDLTFEATGYLANDPPDEFPGGAWVALSVLPGVRSIQTDSFGASFVVGPTIFIGRETDVRAFIGLHVEIPVSRGPAGP